MRITQGNDVSGQRRRSINVRLSPSCRSRAPVILSFPHPPFFCSLIPYKYLMAQSPLSSSSIYFKIPKEDLKKKTLFV